MIKRPLWGLSLKGIKLIRLQVDYNDCLQGLLMDQGGVRGSCSVMQGLKPFRLLRTLIYEFIYRLNDSQNVIIMLLSSLCFTV